MERTRSSSITPSWNPRDRGRSLVSMRTFYAYGAKSAPYGGGGRSSSAAPPIGSLPISYYASYTPQLISPIPLIPRSSTTNFSAASRRLSPTTHSPRLSRRPPPTTDLGRQSPFRRNEPGRYSLRTVYTPISPPLLMPSDLMSISSYSRGTDTPSVAYAAPTPEPTIEARPPLRRSATIDHNANDTSVVLPDKSPEMDELREKNRVLEELITKLQSQVKTGDKMNLELKRKLLESEAEVKVWKAKMEQAQTPVIEIVKDSDAPMDPALFEKLESTAEKFARLNAVNDLKLLQSETVVDDSVPFYKIDQSMSVQVSPCLGDESHIEDALTEISK